MDVAELRTLVGEPDDSNGYTDVVLQVILDANDGDGDRSAAYVWRRKTADYAALFNSGNRSIAQLYDHSKDMLAYYDKRVASGATEPDSPPDPGARPTTRAIVRA